MYDTVKARARDSAVLTECIACQLVIGEDSAVLTECIACQLVIGDPLTKGDNVAGKIAGYLEKNISQGSFYY